MKSYQGSCLCKSVTYEVHSLLKEVGACHCNECRKWTGNQLITAECQDAELIFHHQPTLKWYHSSKMAKRGFCAKCGSLLFFKKLADQKIEYTLGSLLPSQDMANHKIGFHLFTDEKADFYEIDHSIPHYPQDL